jgi:DNA repair exonuclease SbcCD ATPase subunit
MNVKQALKQKERLVKELNSTWGIIRKHNSVLEGNTRQYNIALLLEKVDKLMAEIVEIKQRIHKANQPVYDLIFQMSELKNYLKELQSVDTTDGVVIPNSYGNVTPQKYVAQLNDSTRDTIIEQVTEQINELQDKLDTHNATVNI